MSNSSCTIITAARDVCGRRSAAEKIAQAYTAWKTGGCEKPIFVIPPESDPVRSAAEVTQLGEVPEGAGVLLRTSGSTSGQGKIVALSWQSLEISASATHDYFGGPGVWINVLPLYHIAGFQTVFRSIFAGFTPIIGNFASFADFHKATAKSSAPRHYLSQVPTQLARLLESAPAEWGATNQFSDGSIATEFTAVDPTTKTSAVANSTAADSRTVNAATATPFAAAADYAGIDVNLVGGASIRTDLLQRARELGIRTVTSYGMTETCGGCVYDGFPIGDVQISLSASGQISLGSQVVALGYLGDRDAPEFSTDATRLRWHHTRDWGAITDGVLSVHGRIDDAITTGGLTIIPQLLEDAISAHFHTQCVVVGVPDSLWGEVAVAITAQPLPKNSVREFARSKFERGWTPQQVYSLSEVLLTEPADGTKFPNHAQTSAPTHKSAALSFPLTPSHKIDRRKLALLVAQRMSRCKNV